MPGPWPRDVIVRIDAKEFPEAFAPDGREYLDALRAAASALEIEGGLRVVRDRGPLAGIPKEVRLGPEEVARAYALAEPFGFLRLSKAFERMAAACRDLGRAEPSAPMWMCDFLERAAGAATAFDSSPFGAMRPVFKRTVDDRILALRGAWGVSRGWNTWERVVSERIFRDSKRLATLRPLVIEFLLLADPDWAGVAPDDPDQVLEAYGVRRKPGLLRCAGVGELSIAGRRYQLGDFVPTAHLPEAWAAAWIDAVAPRVRTVTLIENEFPFFSYVEEAGGAEALGRNGELVVYVAGFPTPGLLLALNGLSLRSPSSHWRHWGDADAGGIRIWWHLRNHLKRPLEWFRWTADWLQAAAAGGPALAPKELEGLQRLARHMRSSAFVDENDVREVLGFIDRLQQLGRKVEQERF